MTAVVCDKCGKTLDKDGLYVEVHNQDKKNKRKAANGNITGDYCSYECLSDKAADLAGTPI